MFNLKSTVEWFSPWFAIVYCYIVWNRASFCSTHFSVSGKGFWFRQKKKSLLGCTRKNEEQRTVGVTQKYTRSVEWSDTERAKTLTHRILWKINITLHYCRLGTVGEIVFSVADGQCNQLNTQRYLTKAAIVYLDCCQVVYDYCLGRK